jgi:beta-glucanase (GH16 family)
MKILKYVLMISLMAGFSSVIVGCRERQTSICDVDVTLEGGWKLFFCDGFEGEELNQDVWTAANQKRHGSSVLYYSNRSENVRVENNKLILTSLETPSDTSYNFEYMPYTSARLETKNKLDFKYGRVIVSAKLAPGQGTWPAIWMLSTNSPYGSWPDGGEIDIMEYYGHRPNRVSTAFHTRKYNHMNTNISTIARTVTVADAATTFNTYELIWTSESLTWRINGQNVHFYRYNNRTEALNEGYYQAWPFDQYFHLIINLGMGNAGAGGAGEIDPNILPTTFEIDYVKIYQIDYDQYDIDAPTTPDYVEQSNINNLYILWPRSEDDYGVEHYEVFVDGVLVGTTPVHSFLFEDDFFVGREVQVRAVDFTGKTSDFQTLEWD